MLIVGDLDGDTRPLPQSLPRRGWEILNLIWGEQQTSKFDGEHIKYLRDLQAVVEGGGLDSVLLVACQVFRLGLFEAVFLNCVG